MTIVRHTRLIGLTAAAMVMAVTFAATGTAFALPAKCPSPPALNLHRVHWGDAAIPGQLCRVKGSIQLHNGLATISHSGYGPIEVYTSGPTYGDLGGGLQVAALQVWCANQGGTAAGQIAEGVIVFSGTGGRLHPLGTLTPRYHPPGPVHIPYVAVASISAGHIVTTEYWYTPSDPDCCPSGRAATTWYWNGRHLTPGRTTITGR